MESDYITANNVFAHIDNPSDFAGVRKVISSDNGILF